jgi:hypothetical protein
MQSESTRLCTIDGCVKLSYCRGMCPRHYGRWHRHGDATAGRRDDGSEPAQCSVENCLRVVESRGLCNAHAKRQRKYGDALAPRPAPRRIPVAERFWAKVAKSDGCWLWTGNIERCGYGTFALDHNTPVRSHRYAWESVNLRSVPYGHVVRHLCEGGYPIGDITYRRCVRPSHLTTGTPAQNVADARATGRMARGERMNKYALTETLVRQIRAFKAEGLRGVDIASQLNVGLSAVRHVIDGSSWQHVT